MLASSTLCSLQPWTLKSCKSNPTALKSPKFSTSHGCSRLLRFSRVSCSKMKGLRIPNATTSTFLMCLDPFSYPKSSIGSVLTLIPYQIKPNKKICMQSLCISNRKEAVTLCGIRFGVSGFGFRHPGRGGVGRTSGVLRRPGSGELCRVGFSSMGDHC